MLSVTSKSAITPSFIGLMATILPGVRPNILLASSPTARTLEVPFCIATTGFAGMLFNLILLFAFQTLYGYVFYWIGILISALMVGVVVGGQITTSILGRIKRDLIFLLGIEMSIIIFSMALPLIFSEALSQQYMPIIFLFLSFLSGFLIGLQFPIANKIYLSMKGEPEFSSTAGLLYGADLMGGWLGGIFGGVLLLPVLGLLETCIVVLIFKLCSFIILIGSASSLRQ